MKPGPRTLVVQSPSLWRETARVGHAAFLIVFWSAMAMWCNQPRDVRSSARKAAFDQVAFRDLDSDAQRMFRLAQEGLTEAEDVRSRTNQWPTVESLAARNIPPFASDPIDTAGYHWRMLEDGTLIDYVAAPEPGSPRPTFAIVILEPDPGTPIDPSAATDEVHHKLRDGTLLHVGIWTGKKPMEHAVAMPPLEDGWRQITMADL